MKSIIAYWICILATKFLNLFGRGGSLPGELALKIEPDLLKKIKYPKDVILVTATNGKTSTTNLIASILKESNQKIIYNSKGDNLAYGIVGVLLNHANAKLEVKADVAVLEVDELTFAKIALDLNPTYILVNNFFRDQLDRSGEMESVVQKIEAILTTYKGNLILNYDDPNVIRIKDKAIHAKISTYHLTKTNFTSEYAVEVSEGKFCPVCMSLLDYHYYHYSHIGLFKCNNCGFPNVTPTFSATLQDEIHFNFAMNDVIYEPSIKAIYYVYNCLSIITLCHLLNIDNNVVIRKIKSFQMNLGRNEAITLNGKKVLLNLVKNPTGCNEIIKSIAIKENTQSILFVLNDEVRDSTDVSWIWDVDFERLTNTDLFICCGKRAYELALRIKYGEIKTKIIVVEDIKEALEKLQQSNNELQVMATYTALPVVRKEMQRWS